MSDHNGDPLPGTIFYGSVHPVNHSLYWMGPDRRWRAEVEVCKEYSATPQAIYALGVRGDRPNAEMTDCLLKVHLFYHPGHQNNRAMPPSPACRQASDGSWYLPESPLKVFPQFKILHQKEASDAVACGALTGNPTVLPNHSTFVGGTGTPTGPSGRASLPTSTPVVGGTTTSTPVIGGTTSLGGSSAHTTTQSSLPTVHFGTGLVGPGQPKSIAVHSVDGSDSRKRAGVPTLGRTMITANFSDHDFPTRESIENGRKPIKNRAEAEEYLEGLQVLFPSRHEKGQRVAGQPATFWIEPTALVAACSFQPGLRTFVPELVTQHLLRGSGHVGNDLVPGSPVTRDITDQFLSFCDNSQLMEDCQCVTCQGAALRLQQARQTSVQSSADVTQIQAEARRRLVAGESNLGTRQNPGTVNSKPRLRGVNGLGGNGQFHSVLSHCHKLAEAISHMSATFGEECLDVNARSAFAHLTNILTAQLQLNEAMLMNPHILFDSPASPNGPPRKGDTHRKYCLGRFAWEYVSCETGRTLPKTSVLNPAVLSATSGRYQGPN